MLTKKEAVEKHRLMWQIIEEKGYFTRQDALRDMGVSEEDMPKYYDYCCEYQSQFDDKVKHKEDAGYFPCIHCPIKYSRFSFGLLDCIRGEFQKYMDCLTKDDASYWAGIIKNLPERMDYDDDK